MIYPSKKDTIVLLGFFLGIATTFAVGSLQVYFALFQGAPMPVLVAGIIMILGGLLLMWFFATSYEITESALVVRCGPLRRTIPVDAIVEIHPKKGFSMELGWNLALSQDKLFIRYRNPDGQIALFGVAISPEDPEAFLRELAQAMSGKKTEPGEIPHGGEP